MKNDKNDKERSGEKSLTIRQNCVLQHAKIREFNFCAINVFPPKKEEKLKGEMKRRKNPPQLENIAFSSKVEFYKAAKLDKLFFSTLVCIYFCTILHDEEFCDIVSIKR